MIFGSSPFWLVWSWSRFLRWRSGLQFQIAKNNELVIEALRERRKLYCEEGYITAAAFPDGILRDEFDQCAINFVIRTKSGHAVGVARLVPDSPLGFPIERYFAFVFPRWLPRDSVAEIGRLAIEKSYRRVHNREASRGLLLTMYEESLRRNFTYWLAYMPEKLALSFAEFGMNMARLEELPLTDENRKHRQEFSGYFEKVDSHPYLFDLRRQEK